MFEYAWKQEKNFLKTYFTLVTSFNFGEQGQHFFNNRAKCLLGQ